MRTVKDDSILENVFIEVGGPSEFYEKAVRTIYLSDEQCKVKDVQ